MVSFINLYSCKEDKWIGLLYKDERSMNRYEVYGQFTESSTCTQTGRKMASIYEHGAFECGLNCELKNGDFYVCEKTLDYVD